MGELLKLIGSINIFPDAAIRKQCVVIASGVTVGCAKKRAQTNTVRTGILESNVCGQAKYHIGPI